jgi:hypothetical protein
VSVADQENIGRRLSDAAGSHGSNSHARRLKAEGAKHQKICMVLLYGFDYSVNPIIDADLNGNGLGIWHARGESGPCVRGIGSQTFPDALLHWRKGFFELDGDKRIDDVNGMKRRAGCPGDSQRLRKRDGRAWGEVHADDN